jgi:holo-[acyl-carrier protein] synthase
LMVGTDVVDIERIRRVLERAPGIEARLFTRAELDHCNRKPDPVVSLAGTLAAKEAVMKAAGLSSLPAWARRIEIKRSPEGAPEVEGFALSISHDGGIAVAIALRVSRGSSP